jgi:hypothetical protein
MRSIIEYFCPLCVAPIVHSIGIKTKLSKKSKTKQEKNNTTRNIIIGVIVATITIASLFVIYNRNRNLFSFSPTHKPVSSCGCGL